uniref:Uncharacterized protein n=1 Tax=Rhizophora mucronata TaxID=61149 RepID=A0A2P2PDZ5_RHIMU
MGYCLLSINVSFCISKTKSKIISFQCF